MFENNYELMTMKVRPDTEQSERTEKYEGH